MNAAAFGFPVNLFDEAVDNRQDARLKLNQDAANKFTGKLAEFPEWNQHRSPLPSLQSCEPVASRTTRGSHYMLQHTTHRYNCHTLTVKYFDPIMLEYLDKFISL